MDYSRLILYFDGTSRNNPRGPAGCGWVIYEMNGDGADSSYVASDSHSLGYNISNNQAEYQGLIKGLDYIAENGLNCHTLYIRGDSQIVIRQMEGLYKVRSNNFIPYYQEAQQSLEQINCFRTVFKHVPRNKNTVADGLANDAINYAVILALK